MNCKVIEHLIVKSFLVVFLLFPALPSFACDLDEAIKFYENAFDSYDINQLEMVLACLDGENNHEDDDDILLLKGEVTARLTFFYTVQRDKKKIKEWGKKSVEFFNTYLEKKPDSIKARGIRCLAYQNLASVSWNMGAVYGSRSGGELKDLKKKHPEQFLTNYIEAIMFLETPPFFGGNLKKGLDAFISLQKEYPDKQDVQVYLAYAYSKNKNDNEAMQVIEDVLKANPKNLFAVNIAADIEKNKK